MTEQWRRAPVGSAALKDLVEKLAESLHRSVALVDPSVGRVCSSRHFDDADRARVHVLLQGRPSGDVARHVLAQGVTRWTKPGYVEGRDDLGLLPRYCVPLRERGRLLGLLAVVVPDGSLPPEAVGAIARATPAIVGQLSADHESADPERTREKRLLLSLLGADPAARTDARQQLLDGALLPDAPHAVVCSVQVARSRMPPGQLATALRGTLEDVLRSRSVRGAFAVESNRAVLLRLADRPWAPEALREQSARLVAALGAELDASADPVVGIGGQQRGLAEAWTSHEQALVAVRAARRMPGLEGVGSWDDLGEFAVLLQLPDHALNESLLPKPLRALLESDCGSRLEETLRCFLDHAGSVARTTEELRIHRTSLYYRLRRIQEITGLDLDNGADRFALHLGLRVRELLVSLGAFDDGRYRRPAAAPGGGLVDRSRGAA
ncbi:helix-turn-helix domain-containing protein [Kitasatospora sp. NPDC036755]|uniref:PucR family transcriptional regulator n=1 Tax=Kitasatospora sp. NPDC036755 TaxID=3154600 RepID=UPI0034005D32